MAMGNVAETNNAEQAAYAAKVGAKLLLVVPGPQVTYQFDDSGSKASTAFSDYARGNTQYSRHELVDTMKGLQEKAREAQRSGKPVSASSAPQSISDRTVEKAFEADPAGYLIAKAKRGEELNAAEKAVAWELFKRAIGYDQMTY
jgi:hypothetical protein